MIGIGKFRWASLFGRLAEWRPTRWRRLRIALVLVLCMAASAMVEGSAVASTVSLSSASGQIQGNLSSTSFTAASAPNGVNPSGQMQTGGGTPSSNSSFTGSVTCLSVHGYTATIGATGTEMIGGYTLFGPDSSGPFTRPQSYLVVAVDNSKPPYNVYGGAPPTPPGIDQWGLTRTSTPPDCSMASTVAVGPLMGGDIKVRDARDQPPRIFLPRAIRITVRNRRSVRVVYRVSAKDDFDRHPSLRCTPRSGSRFPIGTTRVRCTARDRSGLTGSATFRVHVKLRR